MKLSTLFLIAITSLSQAAEWPTYRADNRRSSTTKETLTLPLAPKWQHKGGTPQQAWTGPAKWDAFIANNGLQSLRNFDPCHFTTSIDGKVYYGSSSDNAVHCIDSITGKELWAYFTGSAVRLPPTLSNGNAYFGSDDGHAYCVDAQTGKLIWKLLAAPTNRLIPSNNKLISTHPIRTGITIVEGQAIFAASLLPWKSSVLWSVDKATGKLDNGYKHSLTGFTIQGAILQGGDMLYAPQGRAACLKFNAKTGKSAGNVGHAGGVICLLTEDHQLISAPSSQRATDDVITATDKKGKAIATFSGTNLVITDGKIAYMRSQGKLRSVETTNQKKELWAKPQAEPIDIIVAGDHLIIGLAGKVEILDKTNGKVLWSAEIDGDAHGLTVADGKLYISTNKGDIYMFAQ